MNELGRYLGARLMTRWDAMLCVYGAESSPEFDFEESEYNLPFCDALAKIKEYSKTIKENHLDAYLYLQSERDDQTFEADSLEYLCEELMQYGLITEEARDYLLTD